MGAEQTDGRTAGRTQEDAAPGVCRLCAELSGGCAVWGSIVTWQVLRVLVE